MSLNKKCIFFPHHTLLFCMALPATYPALTPPSNLSPWPLWFTRQLLNGKRTSFGCFTYLWQGFRHGQCRISGVGANFKNPRASRHADHHAKELPCEHTRCHSNLLQTCIRLPSKQRRVSDTTNLLDEVCLPHLPAHQELREAEKSTSRHNLPAGATKGSSYAKGVRQQHLSCSLRRTSMAIAQLQLSAFSHPTFRR